MHDAIGRREERELSTIVPFLLLSGLTQGGSGTPASSGTPAVSPDNTLASLLLATALLPDWDRDETLPIVLLALLGTQGFGTQNLTQGNIPTLLLLLPLLRQRGYSGYSEFWELIRANPDILDELRERIEKGRGANIATSLSRLFDSAANALDNVSASSSESPEIKVEEKKKKK